MFWPVGEMHTHKITVTHTGRDGSADLLRFSLQWAEGGKPEIMTESFFLFFLTFLSPASLSSYRSYK